MSDDYARPQREDDPDWTPLYKWQETHPNPGGGSPEFDEWYTEHKKIQDRIWAGWAFHVPTIFEWDDEDVAVLRKLASYHVCGVCGRMDDPGCTYGC